MIIHKQSGRLLTPAQVIDENPNVSFATPFDPPAAYAWVVEAQKPPFNPATHHLVLGALLIEGVYHEQWTIEPLTQEQQTAHVAASAQALQALKAAKNDEINQARLTANRTTFTHAGKQVACDELSRSDIDGTNGQIVNLGELPPGWVGGWKAVDNTIVPIATVAQWRSFYSSMFVTGMTNFMKAQQLKGQLAAATTAEQVAAIHW